MGSDDGKFLHVFDKEGSPATVPSTKVSMTRTDVEGNDLIHVMNVQENDPVTEPNLIRNSDQHDETPSADEPPLANDTAPEESKDHLVTESTNGTALPELKHEQGDTSSGDRHV